MSTPRGPSPLATEAGLTPKTPIVNTDGTPTTFFFRWLLAMRLGATTADDIALLEGFDAGADAAALADFARSIDAAELAAALEGFTGSSESTADQKFLEAALASDAPPATVRPVIRDVLANLPGWLNARDDGQIFEATDYRHSWRWNGATLAWQFVAGDSSGQVVIGKPDGTAPDGGLWALCDGTNTQLSHDDGTVTTVATQNLTGGVFIKGDVIAAQQPASAPTWAAGAATAADSGAGQAVQSGSGATVAAHPHTHPLSAAGAINPPSETNGGLPLRVGVAFWIRR